MADKDIRIKISAKDDASKIIKEVGKTLDKTGESAESTAQQIAKSLVEVSDALEKELLASARAAEALGSALGPELTGRVDVDMLIADFRRLGATTEDIEANADQLALAVKRLDDVQLGRVRSEVDQIDDGMRRVGETTDRSRSVMANFVGNAAQELPGVTGAMGPLNVAIGQFAEYATEGGISAKGFISSLAPMAGIAVAIPLLSKALGGLGDEQREIAARTEEVSEALATETERLLDSADAADAAAIAHLALNTALGEGDKGEEFSRALLRLGVSSEDAIDVMSRLKTNTAATVEELIRSNGALAGFESIMAKAVAQGDSLGEITNYVTQGLVDMGYGVNEATDNLAESLVAENKEMIEALEHLDDVAETTDLDATIGKALEDLAIKFGDAGLAALQATKDITDPIARYEAFTAALQATTVAAEDFGGSLEKSADGAAAAARAGIEAAEAAAELDLANRRAATAAGWLADKEYEAERALREYNAAWDALTGEVDAEQSLMDLQDAFDAVADAALKEGQSVEDAMREQRRDILDAKKKVIDYGREILGLPPEALTDVLALIDEGKAAEAERRLAELERDRKVRLIVDADVGLMDPTGGGGGGVAPLTPDELKWLAAGGGLPPRFQVQVQGATGGIVTKPTMALIGEAGPEAVIPLNRTPGSSPLPASLGGAAPTFNITVNAGLSSPRDTARALAELLQKYGYR